MKPSIPRGTRDFDAITVFKRQHILDTIKSEFQLYGFQPLETPAMEQINTLMGKYGDEGDKLIFKILNNGLSEPSKKEKATKAFEQVLEGKNDANLTERALRYDLTIPFARYVVMNQGTLTFPFKRYQMQPVWRADSPQRGRYREFWQCDADVVGSTSLVNEAELLSIYKNTFLQLGIPGIAIKINNRKILAGLAMAVGKEDKMMDLTIAIDKLDKIGIDKVKEELRNKGFEENDLQIIADFLAIDGDNNHKLQAVQSLIGNADSTIMGINELREVLSYYELLNGNTHPIIIDFTLARGLNYYTGLITEVTTDAVVMGSIGGGGRYDDLTGLFGLKNVSGVGVSFGVDRIYDVMEELTLFPENILTTTEVIFLTFTKEALPTILGYISQLRNAGIAAEFYTEMGKMEKQMKYANKRNIPYVAIMGADELKNDTITLKDMNAGTQSSNSIQEIIQKLQS